MADSSKVAVANFNSSSIMRLPPQLAELQNRLMHAIKLHQKTLIKARAFTGPQSAVKAFHNHLKDLQENIIYITIKQKSVAEDFKKQIELKSALQREEQLKSLKVKASEKKATTSTKVAVQGKSAQSVSSLRNGKSYRNNGNVIDYSTPLPRIPSPPPEEKKPSIVDGYETGTKPHFLANLNLLSVDLIQQMDAKRNERKRRRTANPHFSSAALEEKKKINELLMLGGAKKPRKRVPSPPTQNSAKQVVPVTATTTTTASATSTTAAAATQPKSALIQELQKPVAIAQVIKVPAPTIQPVVKVIKLTLPPQGFITLPNLSTTGGIASTQPTIVTLPVVSATTAVSSAATQPSTIAVSSGIQSSGTPKITLIPFSQRANIHSFSVSPSGITSTSNSSVPVSRATSILISTVAPSVTTSSTTPVSLVTTSSGTTSRAPVLVTSHILSNLEEKRRERDELLKRKHEMDSEKTRLEGQQAELIQKLVALRFQNESIKHEHLQVEQKIKLLQSVIRLLKPNDENEEESSPTEEANDTVAEKLTDEAPDSKGKTEQDLENDLDYNAADDGAGSQSSTDVDEGPADVDEEPADVDEGRADIDEGPADVDEGPADVDEGPADADS